MHRRHFLGLAGSAFLAACLDGPELPTPGSPRLDARPRVVPFGLPAGYTRATVGGTSVLAYLPERALERRVVPVALFLHGANREAESFAEAFRPALDEAGVMFLAPYATAGTWDAVRYVFGPDVPAVDAALAWLFDHVPVDPAHLALTGFSDGATYALALGRANGDLFTRIVAFSPGFLIETTAVGRPPIVVSHGTGDAVLPYRQTSEVIVPALQRQGYDVDFRTFTGGHAVPLSVAREEIARLGA